MPKLPVVSGKKWWLLKRAGFVEVRQRRSRVSMEKVTLDNIYRTVVPMEKVTLDNIYRTVVPMHLELAKGTLLDILQQTGLSRGDLFKLI